MIKPCWPTGHNQNADKNKFVTNMVPHVKSLQMSHLYGTHLATIYESQTNHAQKNNRWPFLFMPHDNNTCGPHAIILSYILVVYWATASKIIIVDALAQSPDYWAAAHGVSILK